MDNNDSPLINSKEFPSVKSLPNLKKNLIYDSYLFISKIDIKVTFFEKQKFMEKILRKV